MKILHIISSLKQGGAETLLCALAHHLHAQGFEQSIIYFHDGPLREKLERLPVKIYHIKGIISLYDPVFLWRLYSTIKKINPDGIHSWLWAANFLSRIFGKLLSIPTLISIHNNDDQNGPVRNILDKHTLDYATAIIAVSPTIAQRYQQNSPKLSNKICMVINGLDYQSFINDQEKNVKIRSAYGLQEHDFVIGSVGRFVALKNYELLINTFKQIYPKYPHLRLMLVGTGPKEHYLRDLVVQLSLQQVVIFIVNQFSVGFYKLFDCFCLTSDKEGISMALLEAMASKLCCVLTNFTSHHDVIENNYNGIIVPAGHQEDLATALKNIIDNKALRNQLAAQGYETLITKFDAQTMYNSYINLYKIYFS